MTVSPGELGALVERASALGVPVVTVELQWDLDEDDQMRCSWCLEICAIVTSPG